MQHVHCCMSLRDVEADHCSIVSVLACPFFKRFSQWGGGAPMGGEGGGGYRKVCSCHIQIDSLNIHMDLQPLTPPLPHHVFLLLFKYCETLFHLMISFAQGCGP